MSNERLERIKERVNYHGHLDDDIEWLIEQAERAQELEEALLQCTDYAGKTKKQNKRYRKVINNINEKAMLYGVDEQVFEAIKEAIKALEREG